VLVGVKASNEVADHGECRNRANHKNDQSERSAEAWGASTSYISYHDIICEIMMRPAMRPTRQWSHCYRNKRQLEELIPGAHLTSPYFFPK
jgi:hypothetical protein